MKEGCLKFVYVIEEIVMYYDFCYLGRYNEVYEVLCDILKVIFGVNFVEMVCNCEIGMCCGVGGGLMWMEEIIGFCINVVCIE